MLCPSSTGSISLYILIPAKNCSKYLESGAKKADFRACRLTVQGCLSKFWGAGMEAVAGSSNAIHGTTWKLLLLVMSAVLVEPAGSQEKPMERGKAVFIANKCTTCHSVEAAQIPRKPKQRNPDLSTAGDSADATYWRAYLRRQRERNGRTHLGPWSGSDADLDSLSHWIGSLQSH